MFTKAGLLIALLLVFLGYRWGKRKAQERCVPQPAQAAPAQPQAAEAPPKKEFISVKALLLIVAVLLLIAILSSLSGKIG